MARDIFRVALSGDFYRADGAPVYPHFDLSSLSLAAGIDLVVLPTRAGELIGPHRLANLDALILEVARIDRSSFAPGGRLKLIARFGTGYDLVDIEACTDAAVAVTTTPDATAEPVATAILALILALSLKLVVKDRLARLGERGWARQSDYPGIGLRGRMLGSLGYGHIAQEMVRLAEPFGMLPIVHDPFVDAAAIRARGIQPASLDELFSMADFVAINCPLNAHTRGMVDRRLLSLMKPTAYLINTARGGIVDQVALTEAILHRHIAGAGLDVFAREPTEASDPLMGAENVVLAPHALAYTDTCISEIGRSVVAAVLDIKNRRIPGTILNRSVIDDRRWRDRVGIVG